MKWEFYWRSRTRSTNIFHSRFVVMISSWFNIPIEFLTKDLSFWCLTNFSKIFFITCVDFCLSIPINFFFKNLSHRQFNSLVLFFVSNETHYFNSWFRSNISNSSWFCCRLLKTENKTNKSKSPWLASGFTTELVSSRFFFDGTRIVAISSSSSSLSW